MAVIGIDLGTTNSLASIWRDGRIELISQCVWRVSDAFCGQLWGRRRDLCGQGGKGAADHSAFGLFCGI